MWGETDKYKASWAPPASVLSCWGHFNVIFFICIPEEKPGKVSLVLGYDQIWALPTLQAITSDPSSRSAYFISCTAMTDGTEAVSGPLSEATSLYLLSGTVRLCYHVSKWWNRGTDKGRSKRGAVGTRGEVTMARICDAALIPVPSGRRHGNQDFNHSCCQTGAPSEAQLIAWTNLQSNDTICCSNARGGFRPRDWWDLGKGSARESFSVNKLLGLLIFTPVRRWWPLRNICFIAADEIILLKMLLCPPSICC